VTGALLSFSSPSAATGCPADPAIDKRATVAAVLDGDTVRLANGRDVRFVGLNTPEFGRDGEPDEPGARAARRALDNLLTTTNRRIALEIAPEREDDYARLLAHPYTPTGKNITRRLLERGLGWRVTVPPNLAHSRCYARAERRARQAQRGVWQGPEPPWRAAAALAGDAGGFHLVRGRIQRVGRSARAFWLELEGLTLRLARADLSYFDGDPAHWQGRRLRVRGWIYRVDGAARMNLRHPAAIEWLGADP